MKRDLPNHPVVIDLVRQVSTLQNSLVSDPAPVAGDPVRRAYRGVADQLPLDAVVPRRPWRSAGLGPTGAPPPWGTWPIDLTDEDVAALRAATDALRSRLTRQDPHPTRAATTMRAVLPALDDLITMVEIRRPE